MSFPFPIESIRQRDADGRLVAAGATWIEFNARRFCGALAASVLAVLYAYTAVDEIVNIGVRPKSYHFVMLLIAAVTILVSGIVMVRTVRRWRVVLFDAGGWIGTPRGFPGNEDLEEMYHSIADIASIGTARSEKDGWFVQVYMRDGDVYTWTQFQDELDAHKIAVTLTNALADIRDAVARPDDRFVAGDALKAGEVALAGAKPGETVDIMID